MGTFVMNSRFYHYAIALIFALYSFDSAFAGNSDNEDNSAQGKRANPNPKYGQELAISSKRTKSVEDEEESNEDADDEDLQLVPQTRVEQGPHVENIYTCLSHICKWLPVKDIGRVALVSFGCNEAFFQSIPSPWPTIRRQAPLDTISPSLFTSRHSLHIVVKIPTYIMGGAANADRFETADLSVFKGLIVQAQSKGPKIVEIIADIDCYKDSNVIGHQRSLSEFEPDITDLFSWMRTIDQSNVSFNFTVPLCNNDLFQGLVTRTKGIKINSLNVRSPYITLQPLLWVADQIRESAVNIKEISYSGDNVFWYGQEDKDQYFVGNAPELSELLFQRCGHKRIFKQYYQ